MGLESQLHCHSWYSILDSAISPKELVSQTVKFGQQAVAQTDHGSLGGLLQFYKECKKAAVKPILGVEAYITNDEDNKLTEKVRDNMHMILLAKDQVGYIRLLELSSAAGTKNFYYKPRIWKESLSYLRGHVVATSACLGGVLSKQCDYTLDMQGRATGCTPRATFFTDLDFYLSIFGSDFYLELQDWDDGSHYQSVYNKLLLNIGREKGIPFVITCDAHYLTPDDQKLHELLMAMQMKMTIQEYKDKGDMVYGPYFYLASPEEMRKRADHLSCPEAWTNTAIIAEQCNVELKLNQWQLPSYNITGEKDYNEFQIWKKEHYGT